MPRHIALAAALIAITATPLPADEKPSDVLRIGIIGLDTSHSIAFTKELNAADPKPDIAGCRIVCAYPHGSADIESSASRIPQYTKDMQEMGIEISDSIADLLGKVDAVLLETNDGRLHLEQFIQCARAGKPVFIDKPTAANLADVVAIYQVAEKYHTPMFSSSSLRYGPDKQAIRNGSIGRILGCDAYSPCALEPTHSDLYWYGIHGVEILYTIMGPGCESVSCRHTADFSQVTGIWSDGRIGTFRGTRAGKHGYGGTVFGTDAVQALEGHAGYRPLVVEIVKFFRTGEAPIPADETIELYAFMSAAEQSRHEHGATITISDTLTAARKEAAKRLKTLDP